MPRPKVSSLSQDETEVMATPIEESPLADDDDTVRRAALQPKGVSYSFNPTPSTEIEDLPLPEPVDADDADDETLQLPALSRATARELANESTLLLPTLSLLLSLYSDIATMQLPAVQRDSSHNGFSAEPASLEEELCPGNERPEGPIHFKEGSRPLPPFVDERSHVQSRRGRARLDPPPPSFIEMDWPEGFPLHLHYLSPRRCPSPTRASFPGSHLYGRRFAWRFVYALSALVILIPLLVRSNLEYRQLQQAQTVLYQVDALSGAIQWQHPVTTPLHIAGVDTQGSFAVVSTGQHMYQLQAYDHNGTLQWQTFASKQSFFLPVASSQPETVLVALGEQAAIPRSNPSLGTYFQQLSFYLLNRVTGHTLWQKTLIGTRQAGHRAAILGADAHFIYVTMLQTSTSHGTPQTTVRLLALEQTTGKLAWHISASPSQTGTLYDGGKLLIEAHHVIWQVAGTLYKATLPTGKLQWYKQLDEDNLPTLFQEESQMTEVAGVLLVARSDAYYALDITSDKERWLIANPSANVDIEQSVAGIRTAGTTLLIYGGNQIQAINVLTKKLLWSQKQLDAIHSLDVSDDGTLVYVTITANIEGGSAVQALLALDMNNGAARWTFQPSETTNFLPLYKQGPLYMHSLLFTLTCAASQEQPTCGAPWLYALNAATGSIVWKDKGLSINDVSADGKTVLFQMTSSPWLNFVQGLRS